MYTISGDGEHKRKRKQWKKERPAWLKPAICEDYRKGMTIHDVALKYHVSSHLASQYIREEGLLGATPKTTPASPAFHDLCEWLLKAKVLLGRAPDEETIVRIIKEVRYETRER